MLVWLPRPLSFTGVSLDSMACLTSPIQFRTVKTKTYQLFYDFHTIAFSTIYLLSFLPTYCYFTQNFQVLSIIVALRLAFSFSFCFQRVVESILI